MAGGPISYERFAAGYPATWTLPLALLVAAFLVLLIVLGLRRDRLSAGGLAVGTAMFLMVAVFVTLVTILIWRVGTLWAPSRFRNWLAAVHPTTSGWLFLASFAALALAVFSYRYRRALARERLSDLFAGVLLNWLLGLLLATFATPGNSYLFLWPLLAALPFLAWTVLGTRDATNTLSRPGFALALLAATVTLLLWLPFLTRFFLANGLGAFFLLAGAIIFVTGMHLPLAAPWLSRAPGILGELLFIASLLFFAGGLSLR